MGVSLQLVSLGRSLVTATSHGMDSEKTIPVRVAVRCRPLVSKEVIEGCQVCTRLVPSEQTVVIRGEKRFIYDYVFGEESSQAAVYEACVSNLLPKIFEGFNVTILAYGQTGSGKTFTMGTCCSSNGVNSEEAGIIPRTVQDIFKHIATSTGKIFLVRASFLEIYKEDVFDLFSKSQGREPLAIREDQSGTIKVTNLTELNVTSPDETVRLLEIGSASRSTASTNMNSRSSRSHAIFTLTVEQQDKENTGATTVAKFHLVDLAGSERAGKTKAVGERLKEGININRGLLSLGNVISALCDGNLHIPYRDSKLTRLLQDSLGGNSHTVMIACISPADSNLEESLNTLRYADRARKIKNKPVVNFDPGQAEIALLRQQLQEAKIELMRSRALQGAGEAGTSGGAEDDESKKELALVLSRNTQLESENHRLVVELHQALDQLSEQSERLILGDLEIQKMKELVVHLSEKIDNSHLADADGDHAASLLKDLQTSILEFSAGEQKRRKMNESLFKVDKPTGTDDKEMTTIKEEDNSEDEIMACEQTQQAPLLEQLRHDATMRRAALNKELDDLNRMLQAKEELASKMHMNDVQLEVIKVQYEATNRELEREIAALKKERDDLSALIASQQGSAKSTSANNGLAEQRRKKIMDLEERVNQLRKQVAEQSRMIRIKQDAERSAKSLQQEILTMKQTRVQLMRRLKEEAERHRRQQSQHVQEVRALRNREQQQKAQMARLERQSALRINVLQRRMEEALAAKNRLEAASRRRQEKNAHANGLEGLRIKNWLREELLVVSESKKLEHHVASLIDERKSIAIEVHSLEKLLKNPVKEEDHADHESRLQELRQMQHEQNDRIAELQQKILDVEPEKRVKSLVSNVNDLIECKAITTQLFQMLVEKDMDTYVAVSKLGEQEHALAESRARIEELEAKVQRLERGFELQVLELKREHQEEKLFLLKHSASSTLQSNPDIDASLVERLECQVQEISRLEHIHDALKKKTEEVEALEMELSRLRTGRKVFFQDFSAKKQKKPLKTKTGNVPPFRLDDLETSIESDFDNKNDPDWCLPSDDDGIENDPDWCLPSEHSKGMGTRKRKSQDDEKPSKSMKRSTSASSCKCRGSCRSGRCGCSKKQKGCTSLCSCKGDCSVAQRLEDSESTTADEGLLETAQQKLVSLQSKH